MGKGQAVIDHLAAYGWAFVVFLVIIGALTWTGVLSPSRFLPSKCQSNEYDINCIDQASKIGASKVLLPLKNTQTNAMRIWDASHDGFSPTSSLCTISGELQIYKDETYFEIGPGGYELGGNQPFNLVVSVIGPENVMNCDLKFFYTGDKSRGGFDFPATVHFRASDRAQK